MASLTPTAAAIVRVLLLVAYTARAISKISSVCVIMYVASPTGLFRLIPQGDYAPNLYKFDQPRQLVGAEAGRSLVTWDQWFTRVHIKGFFGPYDFNTKEVFVPVADGQPLHRGIAHVVSKRVSYFNTTDPATSGGWVGTQIAKVDARFNYEGVLLNNKNEPRPRYVDEYAISAWNSYLSLQPWIMLETPAPKHISGRLLNWYSQASNDSEQIHHAAILAFISAPTGTAVGATSGMNNASKKLPTGVQEAIFTGEFNSTTECGFTSSEAHGHSGEFEYDVCHKKGPFAFWEDVLLQIDSK